MPHDHGPRRGRDHEAGITVVEVMVATLILAIALAATFGALISEQQTSLTSAERSQTTDQVRLAVADIDRLVRSGNVLYNPANELVQNSGVAAGYSLRIYTQGNGTERCVQWRVLNGLLQSRGWSDTWQSDGQVSAWRTVATGMVNTASSAPVPVGPAPFALDSNAAYAGRLVDVDVVAKAAPAGTASMADVEIKDSVTGRNSEYGFDTTVCSTVPAP